MHKLTATASMAIILGLASGAAAADLGERYEPLPLPAAATGISRMQWEFGTRFWYSTGKTRYDIYGPAGNASSGEHLSRLTHDGLDAASGELFFRGDMRNGLFVKGYVGLGSVNGGSLDDEDYTVHGFGTPPYPLGTKYSDTYSKQSGGDLSYFDADLGYTFYNWHKDPLAAPTARLGAFVGYHYWNEKVHDYGVQCNADNVAPGDSNCYPPGSIPINFSTLAISNDVTWSGARLGLTGDLALTDRLKLTAEAAYLFANLDNHDTHHLRTDRRAPTDDSGSGNGVQLEAVLSYDISKMVNIGIGGRYWAADVGNATQVQHYTPTGDANVPEKFKSDRYGVFLQGSLKFGDVETPLK